MSPTTYVQPVSSALTTTGRSASSAWYACHAAPGTPCSHSAAASDQLAVLLLLVAGASLAVETQSHSRKVMVETTSTAALHRKTFGPGICSSASAAACASMRAGTATTADASRKLVGRRASSAISEL